MKIDKNSEVNQAILMVSSRGDHGGGPMCLRNLVEGLRESNYTFSVAIPKQEPFWPILEKECGQNHMVMIPFRRFSLRRLLFLAAYCRKNRVRIVHSHGKGAGMYSRALKLMTGVKVIHTFHGIHHETYNSPTTRLMYVLLERILTRFFTDYTIHVSHSEMNTAKSLEIVGHNSVVVPNGIPIAGYKAGDERRNLHAISTITRFDAEQAKGADIFVRVVKVLKESYPDLVATVIGDGEDRANIKEMIQSFGLTDTVRLLGFREDARSLIRDGGIYVSTSRREGLPLSVLEAMAESCPIVVTSVRGNTEAIRDGVDGLWAEADNPGDIAAKIAVLFENPILSNQLRVSAYSRVTSEYSLDAMCEGVHEIYSRCLAI